MGLLGTMAEETAPQVETEITPAVVTNDAPLDNSPAPNLEETTEFEAPKDDDKSVRADLLRAAKEVSERARDETGKFVKAPKDKPAEAAPAKEAAPVDDKASTKTEEKPIEKPSTAVLDAPRSWGKERTELWNKLPQEARDFLSTREDQISRGFEQYGPVKQLFDAHQPTFQQLGVAPQTFVANAISWHQAFSNPATRDRAVAEFLQSYGINPSTVPQSPEQQQQQFDVNALQPVIQQHVRQATAPLQEQLAAWQNERTQSEIATWAKDKPHFEKVKTAMGKAMATGIATTLDEAYQAAIWADPAIREQLTIAETDKRLKAETERSLKAKSASITPKTNAPSAPVGTKANGKDESVRDSIMQAIALEQERMRA